jgi:hypothetical protein
MAMINKKEMRQIFDSNAYVPMDDPSPNRQDNRLMENVKRQKLPALRASCKFQKRKVYPNLDFGLESTHSRNYFSRRRGNHFLTVLTHAAEESTPMKSKGCHFFS